MNKFKLLWPALALLAAFRVGADGIDPGWQEVDEQGARAVDLSARWYQADMTALRQRLQEVALRRAHEPPLTITLPMADGHLSRFHIFESPIMQDGLARRYPDIRTYKVFGIDEPSASGRLSMTPLGFHAMLHTAQGRILIDPDSGAPQNERFALRTRPTSNTAFSCRVTEFGSAAPAQSPVVARPASGKLRQYRLAVAATAEYVTAVNNNQPTPSRVEQAQAAIVTAINRVNQIYEADLGVTLMLVANNDQLIPSGATDSFSNGNPQQMLGQNQAWIDGKLGSASYDVGHVFGTGGGGLAFLGSTCDANHKAKGVSAISDPTGDPFYVDFVAHEIGHQFDADHSFNGTSSACASARNAATAFEPGSGSSIMGYSGLCGAENLQISSDASFHAGSITQIDSFTTAAGNCFALVDTPQAPGSSSNLGTVAAKTIPADTPFELNVPASPGDSKLMYQWDQVDAGCPTDAGSFGTDIGSNALFRSYPPRVAARRHFPALGTQLRGKFDKAEVIPCNNRDLDLRLTARGNFSGAERVDVRISVRKTGAAFEITNLDSPRTIHTSEQFNVTWNVAGTTREPINCSTVDIDLLTFAPGYASYSVHPLETVANSGVELVQVTPQTNWHPRARIRVKCSDNVFYDISDADLVIDGTSSNPGDVFGDDAIPVFSGNAATTVDAAPACGVPVTCSSDSGVSGTRSGGGSAMDYRALSILLGVLWMVALRRRARAQGLQ